MLGAQHVAPAPGTEQQAPAVPNEYLFSKTDSRVTIGPPSRGDVLLHTEAAGTAPPDAFGPFRVLHQVGAGTLGPAYNVRTISGEQWDLWFEAGGVWTFYGAASPYVVATAGTGDVLTGIIAGFLAQGLDEFDAACAGVYIHAMAGESVRGNIGDCGMIASDLLIQIPRAVKALKEHDHAACH
jgi:hypothetical protein